MSTATIEAAPVDLDDPLNDDADVQANQYVTFTVAGERFAVPMAPVQEIIRVPEVAKLPLAPPALDGLANLRGRVLPIICLRRLFGCEERPRDDATRALVIQIGQPLGFVVDHVSSVINVEPSAIEPATSIQSIVQADYLSGVIRLGQAEGRQEVLLVVDFARLIAIQFAQRPGETRSVAAATGAAGAGAADGADAEDAGAGDELRLVSFAVADQEYALDISEVQEIVQLPERVSALPNTPVHVLGLMSLRQRLLPLVSLRSLFGLPANETSDQQRIVVTVLPGGLFVGLVTDSVKEVLSVPRSKAEPMPGILSTDDQLQEFASICRLDEGRRLVSIIATDKLLRVPAVGVALEAARDVARAGNQDEVQAEADDMEDTTDDDAQVVIFRLGAEEFGVPIMSVQEIVRVPETLTRVPRTPAFVEGVINLRGTVLPVIDQRCRLGLPVVARSESQRIMVYTIGGMRTGFIVDSVAEVLRIPHACITQAPALSTEQSRLIGRVANLQAAKRLVMLIDPTHLLQGSELQAVQSLDLAGSAVAGGSASEAPAGPAGASLSKAA